MALLVALAALLLGGCPGSLENPDRFEGGTPPGGCDAEMLLAQTCGTNAVCHDADAPQGGLDLASPGVASRVIDVMPGLCVMSNVYVSSADPTAAGSFLLEKLAPGASCGSQMPPPPEAPLTPEQITCLTTWVADITGGGGTDAGPMDAAGDAGDGAAP